MKPIVLRCVVVGGIAALAGGTVVSLMTETGVNGAIAAMVIVIASTLIVGRFVGRLCDGDLFRLAVLVLAGQLFRMSIAIALGFIAQLAAAPDAAPLWLGILAGCAASLIMELVDVSRVLRRVDDGQREERIGVTS